MPALPNQPWRGATKVELVDGVTGAKDVWTVSFNNELLDPNTVTDDLSQWDFNATEDDHTTPRRIDMWFHYRRINAANGTPPSWGAYNAFTISLHDQNGTQVGSTTITQAQSGQPGSGTGTLYFFHMDADPLNEAAVGTARFGTLEIRLSVQRTAAVAWGPVNSTGSQSTPPTGMTHNWAAGYLRSKPKMRQFRFSTTLGNPLAALPSPLAYPDGIFTRSTFDSQPWVAFNYITEVINASNQIIRGAQASLNATATIDISFSAATSTNRKIDPNTANTPTAGVGFTSALASYGFHLGWSGTNFPNTTDFIYSWADTGHEAGWTRVTGTQLRRSAMFDANAAITATRHLQANDNAFGTPPSTKNIATGQRQSSDLGFVATRVTNARGEGRNGVTYAYSLRDQMNLVNAKTLSGTTAAAGSVDGYGGLLSWDSSLPGGTWVNTITLSDAAGTQSIDTTNTYSLLATDPRVGTILGGGSMGDQADHFIPGNSLIVGASWINRSTRIGLLPDADTVVCSIARLNIALGRREHLLANGTWAAVIGDAPLATHTMRASAGDARVFVFVVGPTAGAGIDLVSDTSTWGHYDLIIQATANIGGSPYGDDTQVIVAGPKNKHSKYGFDIMGQK